MIHILKKSKKNTQKKSPTIYIHLKLDWQFYDLIIEVYHYGLLRRYKGEH